MHNETSTGVTSRVAEVRKAIDRAAIRRCFLVDTISSLASIDYRHDEWGVDVTVGRVAEGPDAAARAWASTRSREKALAAAKTAQAAALLLGLARHPRPNKDGLLPYTPATNLLYGLSEAIAMLHEEGLDNVFARHQRHAAATRARCARGASRCSASSRPSIRASLTGVVMPAGHDADALRAVMLEQFDMSLGTA